MLPMPEVYMPSVWNTEYSHTHQRFLIEKAYKLGKGSKIYESCMADPSCADLLLLHEHEVSA